MALAGPAEQNKLVLNYHGASDEHNLQMAARLTALLHQFQPAGMCLSTHLDQGDLCVSIRPSLIKGKTSSFWDAGSRIIEITTDCNWKSFNNNLARICGYVAPNIPVEGYKEFEKFFYLDYEKSYPVFDSIAREITMIINPNLHAHILGIIPYRYEQERKKRFLAADNAEQENRKRFPGAEEARQESRKRSLVAVKAAVQGSSHHASHGVASGPGSQSPCIAPMFSSSHAASSSASVGSIASKSRENQLLVNALEAMLREAKGESDINTLAAHLEQIQDIFGNMYVPSAPGGPRA